MNNMLNLYIMVVLTDEKHINIGDENHYNLLIIHIILFYGR